MSDQTPSPAPGWYPQGDGSQRYWDGQVWTEHIAPGQQQTPPDSHRGCKITGIVGGIIILLLIIGGIASNGGKAPDPVADPPAPAVTVSETASARAAGTEAPADDPTPALTTEAPADNPTPALTTEAPGPPAPPALTKAQEQAIGAAQDYLDYSAFSRQALIDQLSSKYGSGFSVKVATFAVDHLDVNWKKQAEKSAQDYLQYQHFSRNGLIQQLESPYGGQFTHAQAVHGVNSTGL
jgi:hypothetical protein